MFVEFRKGEGRRYVSQLHRDDGVVVEFDGGAYNGDVPHDLAHLIVEQELGLRNGVWGVLAAGGMFGHAKVIAGRRKPHATARGREIVAAARDEVMVAELCVRAVCEGRAELLPAGTSPEAVRRARSRLERAGTRWRELPAGGVLEEHWASGARRARAR